MNPKAQELLDASLSHLAELVDERAASEEIQRFLSVCSRFHRYSWCNALLIMTQCPDATRVAGYRAWQSLGRQVKQGEKGIVIFVPFIRKPKNQDTGDEPEKLIGFGTGYVFDVAQTDGDPLPSVDTIGKGDSHQALYNKLLAFSVTQGIEVQEIEHTGSMFVVSPFGSKPSLILRYS